MGEILWFSIRIKIDILLILEPKECSPKVRLVGAHSNVLNRIYTIENELLNGMPYYVDHHRWYAIWFDGTWFDAWFIGYLSSVEEGKLSYGGIHNKEFVECPTDTKHWHEYFDGKWDINLNINLNATLTDYSKWAKYAIRINIDILLILEPKECCSKVRLVGAHSNEWNRIYTKENELLNGMPYYVDYERLYAIWFDGIGDWVIGLLSSVEEGTFSSGFFHNDEFVDCPTDTNDWQEYFDGKWNTNLNATLTDHSKWAKYSGSRFE